MNLVLTITSMALAVWLAYQAGKFSTMIAYDRDVFNVKPDRVMQVFWILDLILSVYFVISIFGRGVTLGAAQ